MPALCNVSTKERESRGLDMEKTWNYFLDQPAIQERFTDRRGNFKGDEAAFSMKELLQNNMEIPWETGAPLTKKHFSRAKVEIDAYAKALTGKFKNLAFFTPEGISKQDPTARRFYTDLNSIISYERVAIGKIMDANARIANYMLEGFIQVNEAKNPNFLRLKGKLKITESPAIKELREIRQELLIDAGNVDKQAQFIEKIENFVQNDVKGETIKQFLKLIHMGKKDFDNIGSGKESTYVDNIKTLKNGEPNPDFGVEMVFNGSVYKAAQVAREQLNDMGKVQIDGLKKLRQLIAIKYTGSSSITVARQQNKKVDLMIGKIDKAIENMELSIKNTDEGYFPHMEFDSMTSIKQHLSKAFENSIGKSEIHFESIVDKIMHRTDWIPDNVRERSSLDFYWEKDPMLVISEYGNQAASFNKLLATQVSYLQAMRALPNVDMKFAKDTKRFIDEEYTVFTEGAMIRPEWVNKTVRTLNAFQTARTMGLNITGAVKNALSAVHFYSRVGFGSWRDQVRDMRTDVDFASLMTTVENRAGFKFQDAATELYAEGLITKEQRDLGNIKFNDRTGQFEIMDPSTQQYRKVTQALKGTADFTLDKLLTFHRLTENFQRKQMFRTAFHMKYKWLTKNGYDPTEARRFSENFALKMVNGWAYEYAAHGKSKMVRGQWKVKDQLEGQGFIASKKVEHGIKGGMSEVAFHLMHYPMSLLSTHWGEFKGIGKALKAGQGMEAPEVQYAMRYAGVAGLIGLFSVLFNTNLFNIFENETVSRLERVYSDLTDFDDPERTTFGLLSEFTGPTIGHLKYLMIAGGIIDMDENTLAQIMLGNVDYSKDDSEISQYQAYQLSTEWGFIKNKMMPAMKRGQGLGNFAMHTFKFYPSWWTKSGSEFLGIKQPKSRKKKTKTIGNQKINKELDIALNLLK